MYKNFILFITTILLIGCSSTDSLQSFAMQEKMLISSHNTSQLIELYKQELRTKENTEIRIKLAQAYLDNDDPESSIFTIAMLSARPNTGLAVLEVEAHSYYELGNYKRALNSALRAYEYDKRNATIENLLGLIYASQQDYVKAKKYFTLARTHFYDDVKIKNNLAVLDIIEHNYQDAVQRLLPLYLNNQADEQIKANLILAMAKIGNFEYVQLLLKNTLSQNEILDRYNLLRNMSMVNQKETQLSKPIIQLPPVNSQTQVQAITPVVNEVNDMRT